MSNRDNPLAVASFAKQRARTQGVRRALLSKMPKPAKRGLRFLLQASLDGMDLLLSRHRDLVPPRYLNFVGDGDFEKTGDEFQRYFVEFGNLMPEHRVLEIGCGIGRMARPLTRYLTTGSYEGIDIVPRGIQWCQENVTTRYPTFRFQLADVRNPQYNPKGRLDPDRYRFPFLDNSFDFVVLTSVFTHMLKSEMVNYSREIHRMLRPGGRCFVTFFLINEEYRRLARTGLSSLMFDHLLNECWILDERAPADAIAYEEEPLLTLFRDLGLSIRGIYYGAWCGRSSYVSYQDIVVATKV